MEAKGGQVRRVHIIYFLSRMGQIEHPHLIRVHHLGRNGVYLRDVKRWLGELRGKDMPEAFAWSYKRRYKAGYVWQDLVDDDLITPISDNEYVLKGSQINNGASELYAETCLLGEKTASILVVEKSPDVHVADDKLQLKPFIKEDSQIERDPDSKIDTPTKFSPEISLDSMVFGSDISTSTLTDEFEIDLSKVGEEKLPETGKQNSDGQSHEKFENYSLPSLYHNLLNRKNKKQGGRKDKTNETGTPDSTSSSSSSQSNFSKSKSYSTGASTVFRNLISCGAVDTNDAVLLLVNKGDKNVLKMSDTRTDTRAEICKADRLGESARSFRTSWDFQQQQYGARKSYDGGRGTNNDKKKPGDFMNQSPFKPLGGPTCSQCGQSFQPEKMHKHIKSCKGMKALAKSAATSAEKIQPHRSSTSSCTDSTCNYLLTN